MTVANKFRLRFDIMIGRFQIEPAEVRILQQLLHEISRARAFGTDPDRIALEVVEGVDRPPAPREQKQRLRLWQPPKGRQAGVGRRRHTVLDESEGGNTAPFFAGEAGNVFDRPRRRNDLQVAVLLERARRQLVAQRVIGPGRRSGQNGSPQERVVAGDGVIEERGGQCDSGKGDQEPPHPRLSTAARPEREVVQKAHASTPDAKSRTSRAV